MKEIIRNNYKIFILVILALNIIGVILELSSPFGGMTVATYYGPRDRFASLGSEYSEALDNLFIVLIAVCLSVTALFSFILNRALQDHSRKTINLATTISIITVVLAITGGVLFNIIRAETNYLDWWLDTGFYTSLIVGLINTFFYAVALRKT